ncbi:phosphotransferase [bacterium]|nr:phosphotransferase [bacterium]
MEKFIADLFEPSILQKGLELFGIDPDTAKILDGYENFIYQCSRDGLDRILRIVHSSHRTIEEINAEMEFLQYLHSREINVAFSLKSINGKYYEVLKVENGEFIVSLFTFANGGMLSMEESNDHEISMEWGRIIGKIHNASNCLKEQEKCLKRSDQITDVKKWLKYSSLLDQEMQVHLMELLKKIECFDHEGYYGIVHADAHRGNFHVHEGSITLFDFDDSCYTSFINDIAIVFYYALPKNGKEFASNEEIIRFVKPFLQGYSENYQLPANQFKEVVMFLRFRDVFLNMLVKATLDCENDEEMSNFLEISEYRVKNSDAYPDGDCIYAIARDVFKEHWTP